MYTTLTIVTIRTLLLMTSLTHLNYELSAVFSKH